MTSVHIDAHEVAQFADRAEQATSAIEVEFLTAMTRSLAAVQRDAMAATPVSTGTLRRSYVAKPTPFLGTLTNTATPYAKVIEEGRRPGAAMPPPGSLLKWMDRAGIATGESDSVRNSIEFLIRRKIGRDGIAATRMMSGALDANLPQIKQEFARALNRAIGKLAS